MVIATVLKAQWVQGVPLHILSMQQPQAGTVRAADNPAAGQAACQGDMTVFSATAPKLTGV